DPGGHPSMDKRRAKRDYVQLLHLHERILAQLHRVRTDLGAPITRQLLKAMKSHTGAAHEATLGRVVSAVEEAIRSLKLSETELRTELLEEPRRVSLEGVSNLPAPLARFLAEREELPGFQYVVLQDEVRGWVIRWKEYTPWGTVRGSGQFYERPYAWLDE
ncbi:MAG TPA: hypothetical protein VE173_08585, partial [Longimicrobiales bacterium]|nr:hypothetical protein [Longimicrobiales bacterium]